MCLLEMNQHHGASLKVPCGLEMVAIGACPGQLCMIYGRVNRKVKFYCKKGFAVLLSSCTRNASFERGEWGASKIWLCFLLFLLTPTNP
jgi:hypothetical protein